MRKRNIHLWGAKIMGEILYNNRLCGDGGEEVRGRIKRMRTGDRIDSDHHPVEVWIEGRVERRKRGERRERAGRVIWGEEGREMFRKKIVRESSRRGSGGS